MRIILFGAGGRLGTAMERLLPQHVFFSPSPAEADITDAASVDAYVREHIANIVVNCAAYNAMDDAETHEDLANLLNGTAAGNVARAADAVGLPVVHFSTDCVFDGARREGYTEDADPAPVSAYGRSKLMGERAVIGANPRAYVVRTSRLYGAGARDAGAKRSFVEIILEQAAREPSFAVNDAEVSAPTFVDDLVRHLDAHVFSGAAAPGTYHMSNTGGCTWYEWAQAIVELRGLSNVVTPRAPTARPAKRPDFSVLLSTKLPAMRPWREALTDYLQHYGN